MSSVQTDIAVNIDNHNQNTHSTILPPTPTTLQKEITSNIKKQEEEFVIYLDKKNDFWHKCFQHDTADKIANFIMSSRWMYVIVMPILITSFMCRYIDMLFDYQYIPATFASLWILCHLFCFNCSMLKRMTKSFVFWYKMYNWCVAIVCYLILSGASHHYTGEGGNILFGTILIIATASHDGSRMNRTLKIIFAFCLLGITILFGGYVYFNGNSQLFGDHSPFTDISFNIFNESLSIRAVCIGSVMNLLIFFTKQCGLLIMYKGKATTLSTRANITWIQIKVKDYKNKKMLEFVVEDIKPAQDEMMYDYIEADYDGEESEVEEPEFVDMCERNATHTDDEKIDEEDEYEEDFVCTCNRNECQCK